MIKVLSIGNSFSVDATRYLTMLAEYTNTDLISKNLYISGCSLEMHYHNIINDAEDYDLQINAKCIRKSSIKSALLEEDWDFVTLQQVSLQSVDYASYQPYLDHLAAYVKEYCPSAKLIIHQTWAYEDQSVKLCEEIGYKKSSEMFADIKQSYEKAACAIKAEGIIPSGELFMKLLQNGISKLHRDTYHASLGLGRYALALLWYKFFTKKDVTDIDFSEFDEPISNEEIEIIKKCVNEII